MLVMANFFGVYLAVGGIAFLVSALSDRRGRAMAVVFAIVLASFLLNFGILSTTSGSRLGCNLNGLCE